MSGWFECAERGDPLALQNFLVSKNQDVDELSQDTNETALQIACRNIEVLGTEGVLPAVRILLRNGANVDIQSWESGETALHISVLQRCPEIASLLIEKGADVNLPLRTTVSYRNVGGKSKMLAIPQKETALHLASKLGDNEICELLVDNQVKLNEKTNNGDTALHIAVRGGFVSIVRLLLSQREEITVETTNNENMTAMDIACATGNLFIAKEIESISMGTLSDPCEAIKEGHLHVALWLLEKGSTPKDPQKALQHLLCVHLFRPGNDYSTLARNSSQKRRRSSSSLELESPVAKRQKTTDVIEIPTDSSEENESPVRLPFPLSPMNREGSVSSPSVSRMFGITLEQQGKLLVLLLKQLKSEGIPLCLEQHIETFIIPTMRFYKSSEPLLYQECKKSIQSSGFVSDLPSNPLSCDSGPVQVGRDGEDAAEDTVKGGRSLLEGNYTDVQQAAREMNLPIEYLQQYLHLLQLKKQMIFRGPPGTGKSFLAKNLAKRIASRGRESDTNRGYWEMVQFHPNYSYEDFMMGFRPVSAQHKVGYELQDGPMVRMIKSAIENPMEIFVMVVDEINRGNVCQVFGELFYLLDDRNCSIRLQYSSEKLQFPPNIYLLATMNTADRSIALLDDALMRRFHFVDLHDVDNRDGVVFHIFKNWYAASGRESVETHTEALFEMLTKVNEILDCADKNVGPSYFMKMDLWPNDTFTEPQRDQCRLNMELTWKYSVLPYIHNALTFDAGVHQTAAKLSSIWEEFMESVFPTKETLDSLSDDNLFSI